MQRTRSRYRTRSFLLRLLFAATGLMLLLSPVMPMTQAAASGPQAGQAKIDPRLLTQVEEEEKATFWIVLRSRANLAGAASAGDWEVQGSMVVDQLQETAESSQADLRTWLEKNGASYESFWLVNALKVTGDEAVLKEAASRPEVAEILADGVYHIPELLPADEEAQIQAIEWNINRIGAPEVWSTFGFRGDGIVVANIDSGVQYNHPALVNQYRGRLPDGTFDHNYNWFDPANVCPGDDPCDNNGHGTHTMGTILGEDGANQIGVAPGATWIAAKGCETSNCSFASLLAAGQWMLAPTDQNGENPRPDLRPHIVNNSWGGPSNTFYQDIVRAWIAAGIFPVFSNGNEGPGCSTAGSPGDYVESYGVGAFDIDNEIADFSSRGPSPSGEIKPNISAPGVSVRSSVPTNNYQSASGTSMAAPHVTGAIALLWSIAPSMIGDIAGTRSLLDRTAIDMDDAQCGGTPADNNVWGEGRLDILAAVNESPVSSAGDLTGVILNAETGLPVAGATVRLSGAGVRFIVTDASGRYSFRRHQGTYSLSVEAFGYLDQTVDGIEIVAGETTTRDVSLTPIPVVFADSSAIVAESFSPANGTIDPSETVTVDFTLRNDGAGATTDLVATLEATGGVTAPNGPQSYGVIGGSGGTGTRPFTFTADPTLECGGTLVATLHLQDGGSDLGTVSFTFTLGNPSVIFSEAFDGVTAPALPAGWTATVATGLAANNWVTSTTTPDSAPNAAFVPDPATVHDVRLDSPPIDVNSSTAQVTFRQSINLEASSTGGVAFDGGVLEISIDGGPFTDIITAGGSFVAGGYTHQISSTFGNLIAGRQAWSGNSGGYITTQVNLPAAAAGTTIRLRWRLATDRSVSRPGWRIDGITVTGAACTFDVVPDGSTITAESFSPVNGVVDPGERVAVDLALRNNGTSPTANLVATLQVLNGVNNPSGPQTYGALAAGGGTGTRPYTFQASRELVCGQVLVATLQLQDGATDLGTAEYDFRLGVARRPLIESFDGVTAPALPAGWTSTVAVGVPASNWVTSTATPDSAPNAAFVPDPANTHDVYLDSPPIAIHSATAQLTFRNNFNLESGFDGGVLEISIGGGPFTDIITAGGSFVAGGYTSTIRTGFGSPIAGRQAWSANSGGYLNTQVNLPASAQGTSVQLRWRLATDRSVSGVGWRVDTIVLDDGFECAANAAPVVTVDPTAQTVQYSDPIAPVSISAADASLDTPLTIATQWNLDGGAFAPGLPEWLTLTSDGCVTSGNDGRCAWRLTGTAPAASGTYGVRVTVSDGVGGEGQADLTITLAQEDALATYTGARFASTGSASSKTAKVTLSATLRDLTAADSNPGDIRNATVTFVNRNAADAVLCTAPIGLVNPADTTTGTATCTWTADLGSASTLSVRVGIVVGGFYNRNSPDDDALITVTKARFGDLVIGSGHLVLSNSAGVKAGDAGSKATFAFTVIQDRTGSRPEGAFLLLVKRTESDGVHTYLIEGTATSLAVQRDPDTATLNGSVKILDITNPRSPVTVDRDAALQVTMDDNGSRSSGDTIGITVWNRSGGLWFASRWNGTQTVEQSLASGNIIVP